MGCLWFGMKMVLPRGLSCDFFVSFLQYTKTKIPFTKEAHSYRTVLIAEHGAT
jgi:hypothetical protein